MHPPLLHYMYSTPEIYQSYSNSVFFEDLTPSRAAMLQCFLKPWLLVGGIMSWWFGTKLVLVPNTWCGGSAW